MEPLYKPEGVEARWQQTWEAEGLYNAEVDPEREPYTIAFPPPNVTGELHMGHALNASIQDALIRWHRMRGFNALWQTGYDHAGIATQNVVERRAREGRQDAPRPRAGGVPRARVGVARKVRAGDHGAASRPGRVDGLPPRADDDGRALRARGDALLRAPARQGADLPREPDRQLVPARHVGDLGPRGQPHPRGRHAHAGSATRSRTGPATSRSRPCVPRRCSRTPASR